MSKKLDGFTISGKQNLYRFDPETQKIEQLSLLFEFTRYGAANCHIPAPVNGQMYLVALTMNAAEKRLKERLKDISKPKIITKL
jgi:hypothetical protein